MTRRSVPSCAVLTCLVVCNAACAGAAAQPHPEEPRRDESPTQPLVMTEQETRARASSGTVPAWTAHDEQVPDGGRHHYWSRSQAERPALGLVDTPFTVEGWFAVKVPTDRFYLGVRGPGNRGWRLAVTNTVVVGTVFSGFDHSVPVALSGTGWHHLAWTYDGAHSSLFLDGRLLARRPETARVLSTPAAIVAGGVHNRASTTVHPTRGWGNELRVSAAVRYRDDFVPPHRVNTDAHTVETWRLW